MQESSKIGKCDNVKTGEVVKFDATVKVENIDFCLKKKQTELEIKLQVINCQTVPFVYQFIKKFEQKYYCVEISVSMKWSTKETF